MYTHTQLVHRVINWKSETQAVSTTAHLTKYTQMKYTAIECTYTSSTLRRWLVLSQMEHLR